MTRLLRVRAGAWLTVEITTLTNGSASYGGSVYVERGGSLSLRGCVLSYNTASVHGGAVWSEGALEMRNAILLGNLALGDGGGVS